VVEHLRLCQTILEELKCCLLAAAEVEEDDVQAAAELVVMFIHLQ
jgi:hypothetical protein